MNDTESTHLDVTWDPQWLRAEVTRLGLVLQDALDELEHDHRSSALAILRGAGS